MTKKISVVALKSHYQKKKNNMSLRRAIEQVALNEDGHKDVSSMKTKVKTAMMALQKMNTELSKLPDDGDLYVVDKQSCSRSR